MPNVDKGLVVKALRDLGAYLQLNGENAFKVRAYDLAAERIAGLTDELGPIIERKELTSLPGIGESIAKKIEEFAATGKMTALDEIRAKFPPKILELMTVPDLGPKKARALFDQLGVGSLEDLEKACREQRVRGLKGFGQKTEDKLLSNLDVARRAAATGGRKRLGDVLPQAEAILAWVK
jgi:DNA polymerase (family 10)